MKGPSFEKMAEQLEATVSENSGDGAQVVVLLMGALVFEKGKPPVLHHAETPGDKDVLIGALKKWIEVLQTGTGTSRWVKR
jgi:hypothetical protein